MNFLKAESINNYCINEKSVFNTLLGDVGKTAKLSTVLRSLGGLLWSVFGFLVQAKRAHHTLNLVSWFVILAEQYIPSMIQY
jgi:hypothetical protein